MEFYIEMLIQLGTKLVEIYGFRDFGVWNILYVGALYLQITIVASLCGLLALIMFDKFYLK